MTASPSHLPALEERVRDAYRVYSSKVLLGGFRTDWRYIASKSITDWALLDKCGVRGKDVLNVGCAEPIDEMMFARRVRSWTAIDFSVESIHVARQVAAAEMSAPLLRRLRFGAADAAALPYADASFDVAVSFSTIEHIPDPGKRASAVKEMARVTKPGGFVVITTSNAWSLLYRRGVNRALKQGTAKVGYECFYSPPELRRILKSNGLHPAAFASDRQFAPHSRLLKYAYRITELFGTRMGYCARKA